MRRQLLGSERATRCAPSGWEQMAQGEACTEEGFGPLDSRRERDLGGLGGDA